MQALVFDGVLRFDPHYSDPEPANDEAFIRVHTAGICNTDLEISRGYKGFSGVLGHEFVGDVQWSPDPAWIGRRVCADINVGCGRCAVCGAGVPGHCEQREVLGLLRRDGAFAEYIAVPEANLYPIPDELADDEAVFVEPLAAAFEILEQLAIGPRDNVVILGDGKLGILCAQVLALTGADLLMIGKHLTNLAIVEDLGIPTTLAGRAELARPNVVVEATGSPAGFQEAIDLVRPRGTVVLKSTGATGASLNLAPIVVKEIRVLGSRCGPFSRAIDALTKKQIRVSPLIQDRFLLEDGVRAMQRAAEPGVLKVLLDMPASSRENNQLRSWIDYRPSLRNATTSSAGTICCSPCARSRTVTWPAASSSSPMIKA